MATRAFVAKLGGGMRKAKRRGSIIATAKGATAIICKFP